VLFNSYDFLFFFLPLTWAGFFAIGHLGKLRLAVPWLVVASLAFYAWWNPPYVVLIVASIGFNYTLGSWIAGRDGRPPARERGRRLALAFGVGANLAALGYFKYAGFLLENVNAVFGSSLSVGPLVLPLAISFFTFQQIAYLVDAWRGEAPGHRLLDYCLFVCFFPQLIAGPIVLHREMLPQFRDRRFGDVEPSHLAVGLAAFGIGLFKKVLIADSLAPYANPVFAGADAGHVPGMLQAWTGVLAYTFQLYFDFSGYSDMAIGLARMFGVRLALNFDSPYKATSLIDFWRRWHMTLSRFLRDYLYIPLGGNRKGTAARYRNLLVTMLLGGLWHGAGWTFVVWGALHGIGLMANHFYRRLAGAPFAAWPRPVRRLAGGTLTFSWVVLGWVFFRAGSLSGALDLLAGLCGMGGSGAPTGDLVPLVALAAAGAVVWLAPNTQQILWDHAPALETYPGEIRPWHRTWLRWQPTTAWAIASTALLLVAVDSLARPTVFLYFQF